MLLLVGWLDVMLLCSGTPFIFSCDVIEPNLVAVARSGVSAICYHGVEVKMKPDRNETVEQKQYLWLGVADQK